MIRSSLNFKCIVQNQKYVLSRVFSAQPVVAEKHSKFEEEWAAAKPFDQVPTLTKLQLFRGFLPGGKFFKININELHKILLKDYGKLVVVPGIFGRPATIMSFEPEDFEKVFRNEGIWPDRRNFETLEYYRSKFRPDIYAEYGGLFNG